jgi:hypothetical protein
VTNADCTSNCCRARPTDGLLVCQPSTICG